MSFLFTIPRQGRSSQNSSKNILISKIPAIILSAILSACGNENSPEVLIPSSNASWVSNLLQTNAPLFSKLDLGSMAFLEATSVQAELHRHFQLSDEFHLKQVRKSKDQSTTKWQHFMFVDENETPVCSDNLKVVSRSNFALGTVPTAPIAVTDTLSPESAFIVTQEFLVQGGEVSAPSDLVLTSGSSCYVLLNGEYWPASQIEMMTLEGNVFRTIATATEVLSFERVNFDATATLSAYDTNPNGTITDYKRTDILDNGYLENENFVTSSFSGERAYSKELTFNYPPEDPEFDEVSLFVHANRHFDWVKEFGFEEDSDVKINLIAHAVIQGSINNGLYVPASGDKPPRIKVADGDGVILANLARDEDVVSHELSHHIVYQYMTSLKGESLILHEGLADTFTFLRTDNPCLGESICPSTSAACEIKGQCLRSAENDYVLNVNTSNDLHSQSQFISGLIWDLRTREFTTKDEFTRLLVEAVTLLLAESGYHDLVAALIIADSELFGGRNCEAIYSGAIRRGLQSHIRNFSCGANRPNIGLLGNEKSTPTLSRSDSKSSLCGVNSLQPTEKEGWSALLILAVAFSIFFEAIFSLRMAYRRSGREKPIL